MGVWTQDFDSGKSSANLWSHFGLYDGKTRAFDQKKNQPLTDQIVLMKTTKFVKPEIFPLTYLIWYWEATLSRWSKSEPSVPSTVWPEDDMMTILNYFVLVLIYPEISW